MRGTATRQPAGHYDLFVDLAVRFNWTPEQIFKMDVLFVDELVMRLEAEAEHEAEKERLAKAKAARRGTRGR